MTLPQAQTAPPGSPRKMTNEEFFAFVEQPEYKGVIFQLFDGSIYPPITEGMPLLMPAPSPLHNVILGRIFAFIFNYLTQYPIGTAFTENVDYIIAPGYVLQADVSFVAAERVDLSAKHFDFAPDFAVEVKSPSNDLIDLGMKAETYLAHGSRMVWVILPDEKLVRVYTPTADGFQVAIRTADDTLTGGDVLPGLSIPVASIFPLEEDKD